MKTYIARQAIFNTQKKTIAYELLFRDGLTNAFPNINPHEATAKVIMHTHLNQGLSHITNGKRAFINFTEECLLSGLPDLLPKDKVVIEILEDVTPSDEVYQRCRALFKAGYILALDDFIHTPQWNRFFNLVKIIKFDLDKTPLATIKPLILILKKRKQLKLLAERVETVEQYNEAISMGFNFFQGYFFKKPEIRESNDVDSGEATLIRVFQELAKPSLNIDTITDCFQQDVGLTYKLLMYINSGILPLKQKITSIKGALVYLGESRIRDLLRLLTTALTIKNKSPELMNIAIVRARSCELMAKKIAPGVSEEAFLTGLLSMIDKILDRPIEDILVKLPVSQSIVDALTKNKEQNVLAIMLRAVRYYEKGKWHDTTKECLKINLNYDLLCDYYNNSLKWASCYEQSVLAQSPTKSKVLVGDNYY